MSDGAAMVVHWLLLQTLLTGAVHVSYAEGLDAGDGYRATTPSKNFELSFATALGAHVTILRSEELCKTLHHTRNAPDVLVHET